MNTALLSIAALNVARPDKVKAKTPSEALF